MCSFSGSFTRRLAGIQLGNVKHDHNPSPTFTRLKLPKHNQALCCIESLCNGHIDGTDNNFCRYFIKQGTKQVIKIIDALEKETGYLSVPFNE